MLGAEAYSLALFLLVHFYLRDAHKADASDVWPSELFSLGQVEPSSPMRMTAHSWGREQQGEACRCGAGGLGGAGGGCSGIGVEAGGELREQPLRRWLRMSEAARPPE